MFGQMKKDNEMVIKTCYLLYLIVFGRTDLMYLPE